jgi:hypothetical protein
MGRRAPREDAKKQAKRTCYIKNNVEKSKVKKPFASTQPISLSLIFSSISRSINHTLKKQAKMQKPHLSLSLSLNKPYYSPWFFPCYINNFSWSWFLSPRTSNSRLSFYLWPSKEQDYIEIKRKIWLTTICSFQRQATGLTNSQIHRRIYSSQIHKVYIGNTVNMWNILDIFGNVLVSLNKMWCAFSIWCAFGQKP